MNKVILLIKDRSLIHYLSVVVIENKLVIYALVQIVFG